MCSESIKTEAIFTKTIIWHILAFGYWVNKNNLFLNKKYIYLVKI